MVKLRYINKQFTMPSFYFKLKPLCMVRIMHIVKFSILYAIATTQYFRIISWPIVPKFLTKGHKTLPLRWWKGCLF